MRFDAPAVDGKAAVKGHQAVIGNDIPTKDSVVEFRFKFGGAQSVTAEFDDRKFNGSHYGHICMARTPADKITLVDQKGLAVAFLQSPGVAHPTKSKNRRHLPVMSSALCLLDRQMVTHDEMKRIALRFFSYAAIFPILFTLPAAACPV